MDAPRPGGASISARARTPSVDLAPLAHLLAQSIPADHEFTTARALPLAQLDGARLRVNLRGVLQRLFAQKEFAATCKAADDSGFLRDIDLPPKTTAAKVGGRLLPGSALQVTSGIEKLHEAVVRELDACLSDDQVAELVRPSANEAIETLRRSLAIGLPKTPTLACLVPVAFTSVDRKADERAQDVGRVLSAVENVEGQDWLDRLIAGIRNQLVREEALEDDIEGTIQSIRMQRSQPGSQIQRYLNFLDDEALSRVRLQVTFRLMEALAAQSRKEGFKQYVARVKRAFEMFGGAEGCALLLDVSSVYGLHNRPDLAHHLRMATFYTVLPVWAEWSVQLVEARGAPNDGFSATREVSYRFRVNGNNPETDKSAFETRIDRAASRLLDEPGPAVRAARSIAELVFLRLVVPDSLEAPTSEDLSDKARAIADALKKDPVRALGRLVESLRSRQSVMDEIAGELQSLLQTKSNRLVDTANRTADRFYATVHKGVVDWSAVLSMSSSATEILVKGDSAHENVAWFENLTITQDPSSVVGALASYRVETTLVERCLTPSGERTHVKMERDLARPVLPVRLVPFVFDKHADTEAGRWRAQEAAGASFNFGCGIDLEYEAKALALSRKPDDKTHHEQMRAATCTAFAMVVYLVVWEVVRRAKALAGNEQLTALMLRLQPKGKEVADTDGNAAVYTIAQAVERALSRELPVRMQGFHTAGSTHTESYRRQGALAALRGGSPMRTQAAGAADPIALLTYATRPCDTHPLYPDADGFIFTMRSYKADHQGEAMMLSPDRVRTRLVDSRAAFRDPQPILEEIARLRNDGYRHIMLLSHHFGNRHIGRAADRHSPHGAFEFLDEASKRFPDTYLYPLRRDVFPATRLHRRTATESAFEVLDFSEHQQMVDTKVAHLRRGLMPIYTFATLDVVVEAGRPQSGFCTYFFEDEPRLSNVQWRETVRQNMLGIGQGAPVRSALISVLRTLHYLESEKLARRTQPLPMLDPFDWAAPVSNNAAGELAVFERRSKGCVLLSFPALLAHVTQVLHKESE